MKLTENLVLGKSRGTDVENIRKLNCWFVSHQRNIQCSHIIAHCVFLNIRIYNEKCLKYLLSLIHTIQNSVFCIFGYLFKKVVHENSCDFSILLVSLSKSERQIGVTKLFSWRKSDIFN